MRKETQFKGNTGKTGFWFLVSSFSSKAPLQNRPIGSQDSKTKIGSS
jgi:hypothetical protein